MGDPQANTSVPFLTAADPGYSSEGGLDPLGLYAIADSLAVRLVPGVRERMRDPRYLTAIAVGMAVCDGVDPDALAADGKSEPWQVFEWYVVEGLVRRLGDSDAVQGLPGVEKGRAAVRNRVHLAAHNYLKTAYVFGFHGIYRGLGEALELWDGSGLLEAGWALVNAWEQDEGLHGFHTDRSAAGAWRRSLRQAVRDGLEEGAGARSPGWSGWDFIAEHLVPRRSGSRELAVLGEALFGTPDHSRHEVLKFLVSPQGRRAWPNPEKSERLLHERFRPRASRPVQGLLDAIFAYEHFARLLQDAFDDCLHALSRTYGRLGPKALAKTPGVASAVEEMGPAYDQAVAALEPVGEHLRFAENFSALTDPGTPAGWVECLLDHHVRNQRRKPPNGKNPWFDRFDDGSIAVRAGYTREEGGRGDDHYVHDYRASPLHSFATHLGLVRA